MVNPLDDQEQAVALWRSRRRRQQRRMWSGLAIMALGYAMLAVEPDATTEWILLRVFGGFAALLGGAALLVGPLIERVLEG